MKKTTSKLAGVAITLCPRRKTAIASGRKLIRNSALIAALALCFTGCRKDDLNNSTEPVAAPFSKSAASSTSIAGVTPFKVLSFNVRHDVSTDPQSITQRQTLIKQIIVDNTPDVFGLQEFSDNAFESWFRTEMSNLGYGEYYSTSLTSSPKAIFFKNSRFTMQSSGTVVIGTANNNTATWVVLTDKVTSKKYFITNSHWQFDNQTERIENSQKLAAAVQQYNTEGLPMIVFGDFNAKPGTTEIENLKADLDVVDALGDSDSGPTFHGWDATGDAKLDWMMSDRNMAFISSQIITTSYNGYWPSDHWPVMATYMPSVFGPTHSDAVGVSASSNTQYFYADVNGDGKDDKIYWNPNFDSGRPRVYLSNGDGTFLTPVVPHTAGASTLSTTRYYFADVNGDGKDDEIRWDPNLNAGHTLVFLATSGGNFSSTYIDNANGPSQGTTTVFNFADVNGDGRADKIYWNYTYDSGHTRVYLANSSGDFGSPISGAEGASTTAGTNFYYADVNGDGKSDKILWHTDISSYTQVYLSDGDGTFTYSSSFTTSGASSGVSTTRFFFTDVNGDGRADKIFWRYNIYGGKLKVYISQTSNVFDGPIYSLWGDSQHLTTEYYFADINGDGKSDQIRWNYTQFSGASRNNFGKSL